MARNLFTRDEVVLCAYVAMHGRKDFSEDLVVRVTNRSLASVRMKIQNIAAMLREEGHKCSPEISSLTGLPTGFKGRRTNWDVVNALPLNDRRSFSALTQAVLERHHLTEQR